MITVPCLLGGGKVWENFLSKRKKKTFFMKSAADETFGNKEENIHDVLAP